jgi:hypothetical protein
MTHLRIPDLTDPKNELVQFLGIVMAVLVWVVDLLDAVDVSTGNSLIASLVAVLSANVVSTKVASGKTLAAATAK